MADFRAELAALIAAYDEHWGRWSAHNEQALNNAVEAARAALVASRWPKPATESPSEPAATAKKGRLPDDLLLEWLRQREPWATWMSPGGILESAHHELVTLLQDAIAAADVGVSQPKQPSAPAPAAEGDGELAQWLEREMPAGTVIGNPSWWADRIARIAQRSLRQPAPASAAVPVALPERPPHLPSPPSHLAPGAWRAGFCAAWEAARSEIERQQQPPQCGEAEELAQWLEGEAKSCAAQFHDRITRAATLLRQLSGNKPLDLDALLSPEGAYEPGTGQEDGAQLRTNRHGNNPQWWAPVYGCDTLDNLLDRIRERILPHLRPQIAGIDVPGGDGDYGDILDLCAAEGVDPRVGVPLLKRAREAWFSAAPADGPAAGEMGELVAWLLEEAVQAANSDASHSAGMLTWAAQVVGEHADPMERQGAQALQPVAVSERLPGPEDCDAEGCIWLWDTERRWVRQYREAASSNTWVGASWVPGPALPLPTTTPAGQEDPIDA